ncbi:hypothetical protein BH20ACI3_BH20ACI3_42200 [soil metagenome]
MHVVPRVVVTDQLRSYHAARIAVMASLEHPRRSIRTTALEFASTHQTMREGDEWFKSAGSAQRFLAAFRIITSHFRSGRHFCIAGVYREMMKRRLAAWELMVGAPEAA